MAEKPEGQELKFEERAKIENLDPSKSMDDIIYDIEIFYSLERKVIERHIEALVKAESNEGKLGTINSICNPNSNERKILLRKIEEKYAKEVDETKEQLLKDAIEEKLFEKKYHPLSKVIINKIR